MATSTIPSVPQTGRLADTLGHLLLDAINDCRSLDPAIFRLEMSSWLVYFGTNNEPSKLCEVCLAGATMACRLNGLSKVVRPKNYTEITPDEFYDASECDRSVKSMRAINHLRNGNVSRAYFELYGESVGQDLIDGYAQLCDDARIFADEPWTNDWSAHLALAHRLIELGL